MGANGVETLILLLPIKKFLPAAASSKEFLYHSVFGKLHKAYGSLFKPGYSS